MGDAGSSDDYSELWDGHSYEAAFTVFNKGVNPESIKKISMYMNGKEIGKWENIILLGGEYAFVKGIPNETITGNMNVKVLIDGREFLSETLSLTETGQIPEKVRGYTFSFYMSERDENGQEVERHSDKLDVFSVPEGHSLRLCLEISKEGFSVLKLDPMYIKVNGVTVWVTYHIGVWMNGNGVFETGIVDLPPGKAMLEAEIDGVVVARSMIEVNYEKESEAQIILSASLFVYI